MHIRKDLCFSGLIIYVLHVCVLLINAKGNKLYLFYKIRPDSPYLLKT